MNILFTHTDLDGVGCAVLAKLAFKENITITYCNYDDIDSTISNYIHSDSFNVKNKCYITDISISDNLAQDINDMVYNPFCLLDHHPTASRLNKYNWCFVKVEDDDTKIKTSGTQLFYNWLVNTKYINKTKSIDKFVEIVTNYDTWCWATLGDSGIICKKINDLYYLYGRHRFIDWCCKQINCDEFPSLSSTDELILEIKQSEIDRYIDDKSKHIIFTHMMKYNVGIVFAEKYFSELGNSLCNKYPDIDFIIMIDMTNMTISYRTIKDDIDLGKDVASLFGGGGHPKAAGSRCDKRIRTNLLEKMFNCDLHLPYNLDEYIRCGEIM